jgi:hypothetical protein
MSVSYSACCACSAVCCSLHRDQTKLRQHPEKALAHAYANWFYIMTECLDKPLKTKLQLPSFYRNVFRCQEAAFSVSRVYPAVCKLLILCLLMGSAGKESSAVLFHRQTFTDSRPGLTASRAVCHIGQPTRHVLSG